jgi:hypothetical protein
LIHTCLVFLIATPLKTNSKIYNGNHTYLAINKKYLIENHHTHSVVLPKIPKIQQYLKDSQSPFGLQIFFLHKTNPQKFSMPIHKAPKTQYPFRSNKTTQKNFPFYTQSFFFFLINFLHKQTQNFRHLQTKEFPKTNIKDFTMLIRFINPVPTNDTIREKYYNVSMNCHKRILCDWFHCKFHDIRISIFLSKKCP